MVASLKLMCFRNASLDVEPLYTFRSHTGPVLCLAMSASGEQVYSGSLDGTIKVWTLPNSNIDPYDSFGMYCFNVSESFSHLRWKSDEAK